MQSAWHMCGQQLLTRQRLFHCSHTYNCQWLGDQHLKIPPPANTDQVELSCKGVLCTYTVHTYIDRYVCTYISMYVCMYVHMYVRAYVCMCVALHYRLSEYKGAHLGTLKEHTSVHQRWVYGTNHHITLSSKSQLTSQSDLGIYWWHASSRMHYTHTWHVVTYHFSCWDM